MEAALHTPMDCWSEFSYVFGAAFQDRIVVRKLNSRSVCVLSCATFWLPTGLMHGVVECRRLKPGGSARARASARELCLWSVRARSTRVCICMRVHRAGTGNMAGGGIAAAAASAVCARAWRLRLTEGARLAAASSQSGKVGVHACVCGTRAVRRGAVEALGSWVRRAVVGTAGHGSWCGR